MNALENRVANVRVDFIEDGEYITLSSENGDTVTYTLLDNRGNVIAGISDESYSFDGEISSADIQIPEDGNKISGEKDYESRFVIVTYQKNGKYNTKKATYKITKFVPITINESDVFNLLGIDSSILPESTVDIYAAYVALKTSMGESFSNALFSDNELSIKANRAILIKSALSLENAILLGVPKIETDSIVSQTRFNLTKKDLEAMFDDLKKELSDLTEEIGGTSEEYEIAAFYVPTLTDPFTGE